MMGSGREEGREQQAERNEGWGGRRLLLAFAVSTLIHIGIALLMRPTYRPVTDFAVDFEVIDVKPGPPPKAEADEPPAEPEPPKAPVKEAIAEAPSLPVEPAAAAAPAESPPGVEEGGVDAGTGSGICMHDLFGFSAPEPTWLLYVSVASFRESTFQQDIGSTFSSFEIGRRLQNLTGLVPADDIEALLVTAGDIFDWRTFQVVASHDKGEEYLERELKKRHAASSLSWKKTDQGLEASLPGQFTFHLVGSGRVLAITHDTSPSSPKTEPEPRALPKNPYAGADGGVPKASSPPPEEANTDSREAEKEPIPKWPRQVTCLTSPETEGNAASKRDASKKELSKKESEVADLVDRARQQLTPDAEGHWPVALLSTRDPRAVGLGSRLGARLGFQLAVVRGYFTDPVRIEGVLTFDGDPKRIGVLAAQWRRSLKQLSGDPFLAMAGVAHLMKNMTVVSEDNRILISLTMTEREVLSTLLFLQLQGKALEQQLRSD